MAAVALYVGGVAVLCQCAVDALAAHILPPSECRGRQHCCLLPHCIPGRKVAVNHAAFVLTQCSQAAGQKH